MTEPKTEPKPDDPLSEPTGPLQSVDIFLLGRLGVSFAFLIVTLLVAQPYLASLTWALVLAVVFVRPHRWVEACLPPSLAAGLSVLLIAVIVVAPFFFVSQRLIYEAINGVAYLQGAIADGDWSSFIEAHPWLKWFGDQFDLRALAGRAADFVTNTGGGLLKQSTGHAITILFAFYMLFFFLRDRRAGIDALVRLSPFSDLETGKLIVRARDTIHAMIYGTLAIAALQGALGGAIFWWLAFPSPLFWAIVMGVLSIVPVLGSFVVWIPATIYLAIEGRWSEAITLGLWGSVVIATADNLVRPMLVHESLRLHTAPTFVAMLGGLQLFGAAGLILGPLAFTMTVLMLEFWRRRADPALQP